MVYVTKETERKNTCTKNGPYHILRYPERLFEGSTEKILNKKVNDYGGEERLPELEGRPRELYKKNFEDGGGKPPVTYFLMVIFCSVKTNNVFL